jgi:hypothetical protein
MSQISHEHALLAVRWLDYGSDPLWTDFPRYWMAFNTLYNAVREDGDSEKEAIREVILRYFDAHQANICLSTLDTYVQDLIHLPPGDDRLDPTDPRYRQNSTRLIEEMNRISDPVRRLSNLMLIVYQVRCNLLHGSKDPVIMRDQELVKSCTPILKSVIPMLADIMDNPSIH